MDGDGDVDVFSATQDDSEIWLFLNDGSLNFGSAVVIDDNVDTPMSVYATDVDRDGDVDVIYADEDGYVSYFAQGADAASDDEWGDAIEIDGSRGEPRWVVAADLDGDNDMDGSVGTQHGVVAVAHGLNRRPAALARTAVAPYPQMRMFLKTTMTMPQLTMVTKAGTARARAPPARLRGGDQPTSAGPDDEEVVDGRRGRVAWGRRGPRRRRARVCFGRVAAAAPRLLAA